MADENETPTAAPARAPRQRTYADTSRGSRRVAEGRVVSTKMEKTIVVYISRLEKHRKYKKYVKRHTKLYAHDEQGVAREGDVVRVMECRPMSRLKRFRLVEVIKKAAGA